MYIKEARPAVIDSDGTVTEGDLDVDNGWNFEEPKLLAERRAAASELIEVLEATSPFYVDGLDNAAMRAYVSWPERMFVVRDGRFLFVGGYGPDDYDVTELEKFLGGALGLKADPAADDGTSIEAMVGDVARK